MSDGVQMLMWISAAAVFLGAIVGLVGYQWGYRKGRKDAHPRGTGEPEFMATNCMYEGREIYLYTTGYGDLGSAAEMARGFAQAYNEGLDVRNTLQRADHFCDDLREQLAHYCPWCGRWFAESIEEGVFCAECSRRLAEHLREGPT